MLSIMVLVLSSLLFYYFFIKPLCYWSNLGIQQTKPLPILGDSWRSVFKTMSFRDFLCMTYNSFPHRRYIGTYQFNIPTLFVKDPELIKRFTIKDFDYFMDHRSFVDPESDPLWGGNLFALKGKKWREMRARLSGCFTNSKMKYIHDLMIEVADNFVEYFLNKNQNLIEVEMKDIFTRYTNDVIATSAFGIKIDSLNTPVNKNTFYLMARNLTNLSDKLKALKFFVYFLMPKIGKFLKLSIFDLHVEMYFKNIIDETIRIRQEYGIVRPDMLNVVLQSRQSIENNNNNNNNKANETGFATPTNTNNEFNTARNITNVQIASQALAFIFAGFDTVSTALSFGSYELAVNKNVQDKLRKEIQQINVENNGNITYDVLLRMEYMDMVVSEILRKWPPFPLFERICTQSYTFQPESLSFDEKKFEIKKGQLIWIPVHAIQRDANFYPNPEQFQPERFSLVNRNNIRPYTYMPFGVGPRICIGSRLALLEIKTLLFKLLLNFEIVPIEKSTIPLILSKDSLNTSVDNGFWFGLKRINKLQQ